MHHFEKEDMYYAIEVFTGKENETIRMIDKYLDKTIAREVFAPERERMKKFRGEWKKIKEYMFPGYIFVDSKDPKALYVELYKIPEFTKLLGKDEKYKKYVALNQEEADFLDELMGKGKKDHTIEISRCVITEGKKIVAIDGPFKGMEGIATKVDLHKRTVVLTKEFMGRMMDFQIGIELIKEKEEEEE